MFKRNFRDLIVRVFLRKGDRVVADYVRVGDLPRLDVITVFKPKNIKFDEWQRVLSFAGFSTDATR